MIPEAATEGSSRHYSIPSSSLADPLGRTPRPLLAGGEQRGSAQFAGSFGLNMLFSHLRTPEQYRQYIDAYREAGGRVIAANRPVFVGPDDIRLRSRRARPADPLAEVPGEGKIPQRPPSPTTRGSVRPSDQLHRRRPRVGRTATPRAARRSPFDVANVEVRWAGLSHDRSWTACGG